MKPIISVQNLSKRYKLGVFNAKTLREEAEAFLARFKRGKAELAEPSGARQAGAQLQPQRGLAGGRDHRSRQVAGPSTLDAQRSTPSAADEFWALRDVSFDVQPGEVIGVIGRNGAGTQAANIAARETAAGSPKGEPSLWETR